MTFRAWAFYMEAAAWPQKRRSGCALKAQHWSRGVDGGFVVWIAVKARLDFAVGRLQGSCVREGRRHGHFPDWASSM
jgi:hypothetical protein